MKKGSLLIFASMMIVLAAFTAFALAEVCPKDGITSTSGCVCGHSPNSTAGYGQAIIGGASMTVISCNNTADGICVEDFKDIPSGIVGNCSSCMDPDCTLSGTFEDITITGYLQGYVKDANGVPIEGAVVTGYPIGYDTPIANIISGNTTFSGYYNYSGYISGEYQFKATSSGYVTNETRMRVKRGEIAWLNFTLTNGSCYSDCTYNDGECHKECDGKTFGPGEECKFFDAVAADRCDGKSKNTPVVIGEYDATRAYWVKCCDGSAPYVDYNGRFDNGRSGLGMINGQGSSDKIKDLYISEQIALLNDEPVKIYTAFWQK